MTCADYRYKIGQLSASTPADEVEAVIEHLTQCRSCRQQDQYLLPPLQTLISMMKQARQSRARQS